MKRYVIVGAGVRCYGAFVKNLTEHFKESVRLVGVYDVNKIRSNEFKKVIGKECTVYDDYDTMLDTEKPDAVIVTTVDSVHHEYIVRALDKGYDVISEKPVTNTFERCLAVREAEKRSGRKVTVTFNCRFMPYFAQIKSAIKENGIGKILAVNYEYCLNRWHGGDYFKRWHRMMKNSQGMLLHKSTHHFDLANWLIGDEPARVTALGNRVYYGNEQKSHAERCSRCPKANECESAKSQTAELDEILYFNAEKEDGYIRDKCCFLPDSDILDNMSVSVAYKNGAILTYSLNLFSQHEGFRLVITGENGVLIASTFDDDKKDENVITVLKKDGAQELKFDKAEGTHSGGDIRMLSMIFGEETGDPLGQLASSYDGFVSAMIGVAANESIKSGKTVELAEYLNKLK